VSGDDTPRTTCHVAREVAAIVVVGLLVDLVFWQTTFHRIVWCHLACMALCACVFAVLTALRDRPSERVGTAAILVVVTATLATLSVTDHTFAHSSNVRWTPFEAQRLGVLTIALLAPPRVWLGIACIVEMTLAPLIAWAVWAPEVRARLPVASPWFVACYGIFAAMVYAHRLARQRVERRAADAQAEAAALERFVRLVISVRDLANTPLQTIELTVALLRCKKSLEEHLLGRLERATQRLVAIGRALEAQEIDARRHFGG
jgi:hypothetical protein